jgi:hypothetical protein
MKEFKARCSKLDSISTTSITEKQHQRIIDLSEKEKLTDKQLAEVKELERKRDYPELTAGTKTYCKLWLKGQIYKRKKEIKSKFIQKGNIMEDNSIDFVAEQLNFGMLFKNEEYFFNEYIEGTPDILTPELVIDVKNSWDFTTIPILEYEIPEPLYYGQLQGYMHLTGRKKALLIYILSDTPIHLIEREAYFWCINNGYEELDIDIHREFLEKMTYNDISNEDKIKIFEVDYNPEYIAQKEKAVKLCRIHIKELIEKRKSEKEKIKQTYEG